ncbi:hypothetical protein TRIATDRAFT_84708 [Trichoderma atroviride IMI 206040]|uniref:Uncharacterized protein n=2 Tax=Hypocrea atroviridis TaxID=63577 RepID=G9P6S0_HYPAI|nr:uncharacterized protein TRIATDRAFT_84708 [Trichoderma atroviride IMI 206040]EHK41490.1 hypothetical protein TRIATDRAFT_84708 [Trichoderma atroviride IMI 206040]
MYGYYSWTASSATQGAESQNAGISSTPPIKQPSTHPTNLLSLLATAQDKQVDFLPIPWDEATSDHDGQASISQSFFNEKLSYVFKRLHRNFKYPAGEIVALRAVISKPSCWDTPRFGAIRISCGWWACVSRLTRRQRSPWPVLVLQKAEHGHLNEFLKSPRGKGLSLREAGLILDILLSTLATYQKRKSDSPSRYHGMLQRQSQTATVYPLFIMQSSPISTPLECSVLDPLQKKNLSNFFSSATAFDPKHRHLDLQEAMKGFAQLVQVMVFPLWRAMYMSVNFLQNRSKCATLENHGFSTYETYMPYLSVLPHHKDFDVEKAQSNHYAKSSFSLYDAYFPHESAFSGEISPNFNVHVAEATAAPAAGKHNSNAGSFPKLTKAKVESSSEDSCPFAFQTAFCYAVRFGTDMDESEARLWVQRSGRAWHDLRSEIEACKADLTPLIYKNLETDFSPISYVDYYEQTKQLADVLEVYDSTVRDTVMVLGDSHPMYLHLSQLRELLLLRKGHR